MLLSTSFALYGFSSTKFYYRSSLILFVDHLPVCLAEVPVSIIIIIIKVSITPSFILTLFLLLTLGACARVTVVVLCDVCLSLCLSINSVTATYLVCTSQPYMIPYGVSKPCIVWILLKTLCTPVLVTFAQDCYLPP